MKAMIFAAGLGTRLKPVTNYGPKALVEVNDLPLIEHVIIKLKAAGITEIIVNVHHFADQIIDFLKSRNNFDISMAISDETDQLLDTGGGLQKAKWFFDNNEPFIVYNTDIISNIDLKELIQFHKNSNSVATLAVKNRETSRYFLFNNQNLLCGWENKKTGEQKISRNEESLNSFAFSGIQVINPEIFELITETGKFSITDLYLRLAKTNNISGFQHNESFWVDLGKLEDFKEAVRLINSAEKGEF